MPATPSGGSRSRRPPTTDRARRPARGAARRVGRPLTPPGRRRGPMSLTPAASARRAPCPQPPDARRTPRAARRRPCGPRGPASTTAPVPSRRDHRVRSRGAGARPPWRSSGSLGQMCRSALACSSGMPSRAQRAPAYLDRATRCRSGSPTVERPSATRRSGACLGMSIRRSRRMVSSGAIRDGDHAEENRRSRWLGRRRRDEAELGHRVADERAW